MSLATKAAVLAILLTFALPAFAGGIILDLGLPCGPASPAGCRYALNTSSATSFRNTGYLLYSEPGRLVQAGWENSGMSRDDRYEDASTDLFGWYQYIGGYNFSDFYSAGWTDEFQYGLDYGIGWWKDVFSAGSYASRSENGWGVVLSSDRVMITLTSWGWGNFSESWNNYFREAGGVAWANGSMSYESISWSGGGSGSNWYNFYQTTYADPSAPTPEPATLFAIGGGLIGLALAARRRRLALRSV